jgi:extracellular elastinolytic metalloproteinase
LVQSVPSVTATFDEQSGMTRSLMNGQGYLTPENRERAPLDIALEYTRSNVDLLGLQAGDLAEFEIADIVPNQATGSTHIYLQQTFQGLPVYNAQLQINVNRDGRILSVNNAFVPMLSSAVNRMAPSVSAADAVSRGSAQLRRPLRTPPRVLREAAALNRETTLDHAGISTEPITARLMLLPIRRAEIRLVWNFQLHTLDSEHAFDFTVDAESGEVWTRFDWMTSSQYTVYQRPVESPNHTSPLPPSDGRTVQVNPEDLVASPFGWHDINGVAGPEYTITRGNNVHAYEDSNNDGLPPAVEVDCGPSLLCSFPINLLTVPGGYVPAAVTNLFYWNNTLHDIQYRYGFTEAAGNFQVNNYGRGGLGNDDLRAEALDGGGTNNANMLTPPDGQRPRMQMYVWTSASPTRTSDLDAGVIVHEYGHGISNRLVGGPSNVSCLGNRQQPGEGLSDWWALVYTAKPGDSGPMGRGMGTYLVNQPTTGGGIRAQRYSTDPAINTWTYESINGAAVPHGVGSVWAQAAWEMYWALVNRYGFDPNLYNALGGAGNQRAMLYVNEGLMNTACSPTFTDVRDGILQAAIDNYGGQDVCLLWDTFAAFGLGADAVSGGSGSTSPTNGFSTPFYCLTVPPPSVAVAGVTVGEAAGTANFTVSLSGARPYPVSVNYATADQSARSAVSSVTHANTTPIAIPTVGTAVPYPSTIFVPSSPGPITGMTVTLHGFSHTYIYDLNVLLVGPGGQKVMLMSNVQQTGYSGTLTFSDAGLPMPDGLSSGLVRPSGPGPSYSYVPPPAPPAPYGQALAAFNGSNVAGTWSLYIYDWLTQDAGTVAGGWSLTFTTGDYIPASGTVTFAPGVTSMPIPVSIINDPVGESSEIFLLNLTKASNATLGNQSAVGTIIDDDGGPPPPPPNPLGDVVGDFGGAGLWALYNQAGSPQWSQLHSMNPSLISAVNLDGNSSSDVVAVFPGFGLWARMNNTTWVPLHNLAPSHVVAGDLDGNGGDELIANFPGAGLWIWMNNASWVNLHGLNPVALATGNIDGDQQNRADVILSFAGAGVWVWKNNASWESVHSADATKIRTGDLDGNGKADVVVDFVGRGVWTLFNGSSWAPLLNANVSAIAIANIDNDPAGKSDVAIALSVYGTWVWFNNSTWVQINGVTASLLAAGNLDTDARADLVAFFPGYGLFAFMNNTAYTLLHSLQPEAVVIGRIDGS